jgi:ligand-binding sensor domain-containing protein
MLTTVMNSKRVVLLMVFTWVSLLQVKAQNLPVDAETKKILYQETVESDSLTKAVLSERAKAWMINFYKSDRLDMNDVANSRIMKEGYFIIKLTYDYKYKSENNISYMITIASKEGKYRYSITDFKFFNVKSGPKTVVPLETAYAKMNTQNKGEANAQIPKEIATLVEDLKKFMSTGQIKNKDDW